MPAHLIRSRVAPRRSSRCFLGLGLVVLAALLPTAPAAASSGQDDLGGIGLRLVDAPIAAKDDPRARVYIVDHLAPGTVVERRVEISNTTATDQDVVLYAAAASVDEGTFVGAEGRTLNDLASWTSVGPAAAEVSTGGKVMSTVTISIPPDAAPGEQYAVVWAEVRSAPADDGGVAQVSRVGIRLYVSVGPGGAPAADFEIDSLTAERAADGTPVISAALHNTGGRALDMQGTLDLSDGPGGLGAGPFPAELGSTLAIGASQSVRIPLDQRLPDGPWTAVVTLNSGLTERSATATITFPASGSAEAVPVAQAAGGGPDALIALGVVGVILLAIAAAFWLARRLRTGREQRTDIPAPRHRAAT